MRINEVAIEIEHLLYVSDGFGVLGLEVNEHHADAAAPSNRLLHHEVKHYARILATGERDVDTLEVIEDQGDARSRSA
jgi:hypothetical protein